MLVSAKEMLQKAKAGHYAVGQFNINNLEWTKSILQTAQELNSPVILGFCQGTAGKFRNLDCLGTALPPDNNPTSSLPYFSQKEKGLSKVFYHNLHRLFLVLYLHFAVAPTVLPVQSPCHFFQ